MILNHSYGKEKDIRRLLSKSMLNMDPVTISAWMKYKYDPKGMFCVIEDQKVVACLQTKERILNYEGKKSKVLVLSLACTLPDYRQRHYFSQLIDAVMHYASCNHMLTICYTNFPKILESKSFQVISKTKYYWLELENWAQGDLRNIRTYRPEMNLFSIYQQFLKHFDGSVQLNKKEFDEQIHYFINCNHRIVTMYDEDTLRGFAIYKVIQDHIEIEILIYMDSVSILDLLAYLSTRCKSVSFIVSQAEHFEKLFPMEIPRNQGIVMARLSNYKLFSVWSGHDVHHAKEAFSLLEKPSWNHMID